jgi:DNA repair protein RadD
MCGFTRHREWVCLEHSGYPREKAIKWWARWGVGTPPTSVDDALDLTGQMRHPSHIAVKPAGKYTEIVGYQGDNE